jgi:hypothetical protein
MSFISALLAFTVELPPGNLMILGLKPVDSNI